MRGILDLLRAIRSDVGDIKADIREIKERLGILKNQYARLSNRIDRATGDIERIRHHSVGHDQSQPAIHVNLFVNRS